MFPSGEGFIRGRTIFHQFHVGEQASARIFAFNQIVAQDGVLRETVAHRLVERPHIVNPFAGIAGPPIQILIKVGHRSRVGIEPGMAAEDLRQARSRGRFHAHRHAWPENA